MTQPKKTDRLSAEEQAKRAESALEESLAERNELWAELQRRISVERELEHYRHAYHRLVHSNSWRLTAPLRSATWFLRQIPELGRRLRRFVAARPRSR
jgi:hypothetical protein